MRVITAPGVEIKEIDKSQYSPAMTGTNCYVMGFANKGEAYLPMEFTSRAAWISYYGEPDNEAEKYFYNACVEVLNNNGRLYCARLPYDNESFQQAIGFEYNITDTTFNDITTKLGTSKNDEDTMKYMFNDITKVDSSISDVAFIEPSSCPKMFDLDTIDEYRTGELKVSQDKFLIVDKTFGTYRKTQEKPGRKNEKCEMLGIVPVVTTAANAMLAQNLIQVEKYNVRYYETIGNVYSQAIDGIFNVNNLGNINIISSATYIDSGYVNDELVMQLNSACKKYLFKAETVENTEINKINDLVDLLNNLVEDENNNISNDTLLSAIDVDEHGISDIVSTHNNLIEELCKDKDVEQTVKDMLNNLSVDANVHTIRNLADRIEELYQIYYSDINYVPEDGDDSLPETVSQVANNYFTTIEFDTETNSFKRENLKDIGVVVFKTYADPSEGNKIRFEAVESFVGSLNKDDKDPTTGVTKFLDTIINTNSQYIYFFSNCFDNGCNINAKKYKDEIDICLMKPTSTCGSLGFFKKQTEEKISISKSIYEGMNQCFEKISDINKLDIDIICDAGISNIAQYLKALYNDNPGYYDIDVRSADGTPLITLWKCEKNDDVKVWKTVIQKIDTFCKNVRKDCMFITECPRPLVLTGNKKIVRSSKPKNNIDVNILPYVKWITGLNTNYGAGYMDWFEIADEYTGDFFWLPPSIKAMGVYINTDVNFNYWDAPAGLNRGKISATDVAFSPTAKQAGSIYEKNWNYAINYPQDGIILEGQKTFQFLPSAFDRVNVRRLFLRLERMAYKVARYFVYEGNTAYNRQRLVDALDPYFKEAKIGGGIYDYRIVCDESNNTPESIDRNELNVSIAIKPTKTIEFIMLNFIAGRTGSTWEELLG